MRRLDRYTRSTDALTCQYRAWLLAHSPPPVRRSLALWLEQPWFLWTATQIRALDEVGRTVGDATDEWRFLWRLVRDQALLATHGLSASAVLDEASLHCCFPYENQAALWMDCRHEDESPVIQLLVKVLPHKCKRRQFGPKVLRLMQRDGTAARAILMSLICTGLLGNYRTARSVPDDAAYRLSLYRAATAPDGWVQQLVLAAPLLAALAGREYMMATLRDMPVLRRHAQSMFAVAELDNAATHAMDQVRTAVARAFDPQTDPGVWLPALGQKVSQICDDSHNTILPMCYPRARASFMSEIFSLRLPGLLPTPNDHVSRALGLIVGGLDPVETTDERAAEEIVSRLPLLGCSNESMHRISRLQQLFDCERWGKRAFKREVLHNLFPCFPLALAIMRLAVQFWRLHTDGRIVPLSMRSWHAQSAALHARLTHRLQVPNAPRGPLLVAQESAWFYLCHICGTIYSRVRRPSARHKTYLYGLRRCGVQLLSDGLEPYCVGHNQRLGHMRCGDVPLVRVSLLGAMLVFRRSVYFLCTGPRCGAMGQFHPHTTVLGPAGPLCFGCSVASRVADMQRFLVRASGGVPFRLRPYGGRAAPARMLEALQCCICAARATGKKAQPLSQTAPTTLERRLMDRVAHHAGLSAHRTRDYTETQFQSNETHHASSTAGFFVYPNGALLCKHHQRDYVLDSAKGARLALTAGATHIAGRLWAIRRAYIDMRNNALYASKRRRVY